jgi:predicted nucleotidyltransferase component of viral defense system
MINSELLQKIKLHTVSALMADDILMGILVLKGGNALDLAYEITNRGSIDIDFSMEKDFSEQEKKRLLNQISFLLNNEFKRDSLVAIDIRFSDRPQQINEAVKDFWGGYILEFKLIPQDKYDELVGNDESLRRNALQIHSDNSTKFTVDISKYEYVSDKRAKDIDGSVVYVYSPEMLALEKLRALCQQNPAYKEIVYSMTQKSRARDFYDIYNLSTSFAIDFTSEDNVQVCKYIFEAKRVPLEYISLLPEQRDFHAQSWDSVVNTVSQKENLKNFDFYFDHVIALFQHLV